jgi:hypothetical protein
MAAPTLSQKVLKEAKQQATFQANKVLTAYKRALLKTWKDIETLFSITVPDIYKDRPFDYANVSGFARWWMTSFESRLSAAIENRVEQKRIYIDKDVSTFGDVTLYPEQEGVYKAIYSSMFVERRIRAALNDGYTGSGKTIFTAAIIRKLVDDGLLERPDMFTRLHPIMIFAPKGVCEHWRRELERFGLGDLVRKRKIYVISDSIFSTEYGDAICSEQENYITEEKYYEWNKLMTPYFCVVDECHRYARWSSTRFKKMMALANASLEHYMLFLSATPFEKVNDAALFTIACHTKFMDVDVREDTFKYFASLMDPLNPDKPNKEALGRLRKTLSSNIFSIPYVKPKYKAINRVVLIEFFNDRHRAVYASAFERLVEAKRKSGQNTMWGKFQIFIELLAFNKTAEPLRAWYAAKLASEDYFSGQRAPVIFSKYKETLTEVVFQLVDTYKIPRELIAIIWGGKREYKTDEMMTKEELNNILATRDMGDLLRDKVLLKKIRMSLKFLQDQEEHMETVEAQQYRHMRLKELSLLGKQSDNARQVEIDRFQSGEAVICCATIDSGGVGLSLDKNKEWLLDRHGLFTPIYSGKQYKQALGRLVRRASCADALQETLMLRGTTEETHVAPILDSKLRSMAEFSPHVMDQMVGLLTENIPIISPPKLRTIEEAAADAEKDDTIIHESPDEDDPEDTDSIENEDDLLS